MESVVLTHLTIPEVKMLFRQELQDFFKEFRTSQQPDQQDQWFDIAQASAYTRLAEQTIYQNDIPRHKKGKKLMFLRSEVDAWLKEGRKLTSADAAASADGFLAGKRRKAASNYPQ